MTGGVQIRPACSKDGRAIREIYRALGRPDRGRIRYSEYLVAVQEDLLIGCAAVRQTSSGGYLYGLAVRRENQRLGIGSALTLARVHRVREHGGRLAAVLAMFWNVRFFKRLGFRLTPKRELAASIQHLADFRDPLYRRSAALVLTLADRRGSR